MKQHSITQKRNIKAAAGSLYQALCSMENSAEIRQFLLDLCTPAELEAMVDRWWVALLLTEDRTYREISDITGVSVTTIGRVARFINMGEGGYRIALKRVAARAS